jgi:hypothetical protein
MFFPGFIHFAARSALRTSWTCRRATTKAPTGTPPCAWLTTAFDEGIADRMSQKNIFFFWEEANTQQGRAHIRHLHPDWNVFTKTNDL